MDENKILKDSMIKGFADLASAYHYLESPSKRDLQEYLLYPWVFFHA